jgi:hypothetical protein
MSDQQKTTEEQEQPYAPAASGNDRDTRRRALKGQLAAATTAGDTGGAEDLRGQLDKLDADRALAENKTTAAATRKAAAEAGGGDAATKPPVARTAPVKATTAKAGKE